MFGDGLRSVEGDPFGMEDLRGDLSTDAAPPTTIPLRHFVVGFGFLALGTAVGVGSTAGSLAATGGSFLAAGLDGVAVAHLLFAGWVGITIFGAMTQFVPVWAGVELYSDRLASLDLTLSAVGVAGFAGLLWIGRPAATAAFATVLLAGVWAFAANLLATLWRARPLDVTERHFAAAVGYLALAASLGWLLAIDYRYGLFPATGLGWPDAVAGVVGSGGLSRSAVADAHVTLAVLGGVLTTVVAALYQLGPMFTREQPTAVDRVATQLESVAAPTGVLVLAGGRLTGVEGVATVGGVAVALGTGLAGAVLLRRVLAASGATTPMVSRYAVVGVAAVAWATSAALAWTDSATGAAVRFGHPTLGLPLFAALVGFVVVGTLYHVVPFIVWLERYADRVGLEQVPMIDDLYDARIARTDLWCTLTGALLVVVGVAGGLDIAGGAGVGSVPVATSIGLVVRAGLVLVALGVALFVANVARVVVEHAPGALRGESDG